MSRNLTKTPAFKLEWFLEHPNIENKVLECIQELKVLGETSAYSNPNRQGFPILERHQEQQFLRF